MSENSQTKFERIKSIKKFEQLLIPTFGYSYFEARNDRYCFDFQSWRF